MTPKMRRFVALKAMGVANKEAAIQAGYAANSADVSAGKLMMRADIKAAIEEAQTSSGSEAAQGMPRQHYPDSLTFLVDVMNHAAFPVAMRMDAARHLLPYQHAKLAEQGKKAKRKEEADKQTKAGRFRSDAPPHLRLVDRE